MSPEEFEQLCERARRVPNPPPTTLEFLTREILAGTLFDEPNDDAAEALRYAFHRPDPDLRPRRTKVVSCRVIERRELPP